MCEKTHKINNLEQTSKRNQDSRVVRAELVLYLYRDLLNN